MKFLLSIIVILGAISFFMISSLKLSLYLGIKSVDELSTNFKFVASISFLAAISISIVGIGFTLIDETSSNLDILGLLKSVGISFLLTFVGTAFLLVVLYPIFKNSKR